MIGLNIQTNHQVGHSEKISFVNDPKVNLSLLNQSDIKKIQTDLNATFLKMINDETKFDESFEEIQNQLKPIVGKNSREELNAFLSKIKLTPDTKRQSYQVILNKEVTDSEDLKQFMSSQDINHLFHSLSQAVFFHTEGMKENFFKKLRDFKKKKTQEFLNKNKHPYINMVDLTKVLKKSDKTAEEKTQEHQKISNQLLQYSNKAGFKAELLKQQEYLNKLNNTTLMKNAGNVQGKNASHKSNNDGLNKLISDKLNNRIQHSQLNGLGDKDFNHHDTILPIDIQLKNKMDRFINTLLHNDDNIILLLIMYYEMQYTFYGAKGAHVVEKEKNDLEKMDKEKGFINETQRMDNKLDPKKPDDSIEFPTDLANQIDKLVNPSLLLPDGKYGNVFDLISRNKPSKDGKGYMCTADDLKEISSAIQADKDKTKQINTQDATEITKDSGFATDAITGLKSLFDTLYSLNKQIINSL